jgi:hypothetical protein
MSSDKLCSLKPILPKPEERLGVQFLPSAMISAEDDAGDRRYRMPDAIKLAIACR